MLSGYFYAHPDIRKLKMNETKDNLQHRATSLWYVVLSSLAISGFAILVADFYGFVHWKVLAGSDLLAIHGTPAWDRAFSMLTRLECIRPITGLIALIFALWAIRYLPPVGVLQSLC